MFQPPLLDKASSSSCVTSSSAAAVNGGAVAILSRLYEGLLGSGRRLTFVPFLSTFATSTSVVLGGEDSPCTSPAVAVESVAAALVGPALPQTPPPLVMKSSSVGNVVSQQKPGHNGGLGGSIPLLDGENGGRKLSGNDNSLTMPASPSDSANRTGSKTCCFCWCCCCSCSCITVTNAEEMYPARVNNTTEVSRDDAPSPDEVKLWGESFDRLMQSTKGRKYFREFLKTEFSEENVLFWLACEELKRETNAELVEEKARAIYEDYISILSPKEVSLDSRAREIINRNMVHPSPHTFDEAQLQIYTLMHRDSYPRFLNSNAYKRLVQ